MQTLLPIADKAGAILKARNETVAVAESSAGGLISAALLAVPGASAYYKGGGVFYTRDSRTQLLQMPREQIIPSSEQSALYLANAARTLLDATWAIGETGAAGPTGPSGRLFLAIAGPFEVTTHIETGLPDRVENMRVFAKHALELFLDALEQR
jgi:nicotinamide-nucleotide amidase